MEIQLYKILKKNKFRLTKQQFNTIKGQIKAEDYEGAMKGLKNCYEAEDN